MKRSQAINKLAAELYDMFPADYAKIGLEDLEFEVKTDAKIIIKFLENLGMQPPLRHTNEGEEPSDPRYHRLNGWEPENE